MEKSRDDTLKQKLLDSSDEQDTKDTASELDLAESGNVDTVWLVSKKAVPLIIAGFGNALKPTITFYFINNHSTDTTTFAAVGVGIMMMNIFLRSYITGFNNSMITYISQAFGAGDYYQCGEILNRNMVICTICMLPMMIPLFFIGTILVMIGQPVELSWQTQYFVRIAMPGFIAQLHYDIYRKYLNSLRLFSSHMFIPMISLVFHYMFCYTFIAFLEMDLTGIGIVTMLQPVGNWLLIYIVVYYGQGAKYTHGISWTAFTGWMEIIREGIPSYFLQFVTTISLETLILTTGFISVSLVVANTAYINIFFLLYISIVGVQQSSGPMIGNKIGAGDLSGALKIIQANIIFGLTFGVLVIGLIFNFQDTVIRFYIRDEEIISMMKDMLPAFCLCLYLTIYKDILIGIIIGLGLQTQTLHYTIVSFFLIYLPSLGCLTFYFDSAGNGPWNSLSIVLFTSILYYHYLVHRKISEEKIEDQKAKDEIEQIRKIESIC